MIKQAKVNYHPLDFNQKIRLKNNYHLLLIIKNNF